MIPFFLLISSYSKTWRKIIATSTLIVFTCCAILYQPTNVFSQNILYLPLPGNYLSLGPAFSPPRLTGIKIYRENPFRFDFILDKDNTPLTDQQLNFTSQRLIKYFLAALTIPEKDLWVNLSPYEKNRIIPEAFGQTGMGRDLLSQDYILKQITASLINPENKLGKEFWNRVYAEALKQYGTTDIPIDTFNKVWITPSAASVYEHNDAAVVVKSHLKIMLDEDYSASKRNTPNDSILIPETPKLGSDFIRTVILPVLENEINEGRNFAPLRQIYHSLILATWYKQKIKNTLLSQTYINRQKTSGIEITDKHETYKIWQRYLETFNKGSFNLIKEDVDAASEENIPRKYFSGGANFDMAQVFELSPTLPVSTGTAQSNIKAYLKPLHTTSFYKQSRQLFKQRKVAVKFKQLNLTSIRMLSPTLTEFYPGGAFEMKEEYSTDMIIKRMIGPKETRPIMKYTLTFKKKSGETVLRYSFLDGRSLDQNVLGVSGLEILDMTQEKILIIMREYHLINDNPELTNEIRDFYKELLPALNLTDKKTFTLFARKSIGLTKTQIRTIINSMSMENKNNPASILKALREFPRDQHPLSKYPAIPDLNAKIYTLFIKHMIHLAQQNKYDRLGHRVVTPDCIPNIFLYKLHQMDMKLLPKEIAPYNAIMAKIDKKKLLESTYNLILGDEEPNVLYNLYVERDLTNDRNKKNTAPELLKGGIDLTRKEINTTINQGIHPIIFTIDPAMLQHMHESNGVTPVIIRISPLNGLPDFLGINPGQNR